MSDRLLYQSEAEQLVSERGLVIAEPEVPSFRFSGTSGIQGMNIFTGTNDMIDAYILKGN